MKYILIAMLFFVSLSAQAGRPLDYDPSCLDQPPKIVKADGGGYSYLSYPTKAQCAVHGTFYVVKLHIGSVKAGQVSVFSYEKETLEQAEMKKAKLNLEFAKWCQFNDVWTTIEPVNF